MEWVFLGLVWFALTWVILAFNYGAHKNDDK